MNLQITTWSLILLFGSFLAMFFFIVFLFQKFSNRQSQVIFAFLMLLFSVILFDHSLRLSDLYKSFPYGLYTSDALWYLIAPLIWIYFKTRIGNRSLVPGDVLHFIPFLFFLFIYRNLPFASASFKIQLLKSFHAQNSTHSTPVKIFILIMMVQILCYLVASFLLIRRYEKKFKSISSGNEYRYLIGLKRVISIFTLYFLFEFTFSTYRNFANYQNQTLDNWSLVVWTLFLTVLAYVVMQNPKQLFSTIRPVKGKFEDLDLELLKKKLLFQMEESLPFLDQNLTLPKLADAIGSTPHQLSFLLNNNMGTSFYDFINTKRVRYAADLLEAGAHNQFSIFGIAQASGFKSKASFYSFFKREFKLTPKQYLKYRNA